MRIGETMQRVGIAVISNLANSGNAVQPIKINSSIQQNRTAVQKIIPN